MRRLASDGFSARRIAGVFGQGRVELDLSSATGYFQHREASLDYGQFSSDRSIAAARKYMAANRTELEEAEKRYGVDKRVITAILLVETRLGTFVGRRGVLDTLATLAALAYPENQGLLWREVAENPKTGQKRRYEKGVKREPATRDDVVRWSERKSDWAYRELVAFLRYTGEHGVDPHEVKGSYAGALGYSQFMPTSILRYAADGNGDGAIDLFTHADAIHSIASYLAANGWKPGLGRARQEKVVRTYNNSGYYVDAILKIRDRLSEGE